MFPFVLNTPRRPALVCIWSATGKPNAPLTCAWVPVDSVTANTSTASISTEGGLRLCA